MMEDEMEEDWIAAAKAELMRLGRDEEEAEEIATGLFEELVDDNVDPEAVDPAEYARDANPTR